MRLLSDNPPTVFQTAEKARAAARAAFDGDEEYDWAVYQDAKGSGRAIVKVFDAADGQTIGYL